MSRVDVENALHAWVVTATGLAPERVIWEAQDARLPAVDFITMRITGSVGLGVGAELVYEHDDSAPQGEEVTTTATELTEFSLTVQARTSSALGDACASELLKRARVYLSLEGVCAALAANDVSCFDLGSVRDLPIIESTTVRARALLTPRFYTRSVVSEKTTFIETVEAEGVLAVEVTDASTGTVYELL